MDLRTLDADDMDLIGCRVGRIVLQKFVGEGGMGAVYVGYDEALKRRVAVKALRASHRYDAAARSALLEEARLLSQIEHPAISRLYDIVEGEDSDFLILELIDGVSLRQILQEGPAGGPPEEPYAIAEQIAEALVAAHGRRIVHRDLKPENVMLTQDGQVKILDFGLARRRRSGTEEHPDLAADAGAGATPGATVADVDAADVDAADVDAADVDAADVDAADVDTADVDTALRPDNATAVSHGRGVVGTARYMSPEQARGEVASEAGDMYSFGVLLQELFTGKSAYEPGLTWLELMERVGRGESLPVQGVEAGLADLIERLKSPDPRDRPSAEETLKQLRWLQEKPHRRRRRLLAASVATVTFLAGIAFVLLTSPYRESRPPPEVQEPGNPLFVDPESRDFSSNPDLLERLRESPHGYFRFINVRFSREVCRRFESAIAESPSFNLHGDAHVEQYAVTSLGRGMTDFDDSSTGPGILDLARYGVSTMLACEQAGCVAQAPALVERFLNGYESALEKPEIEVAEPRLVREIRATFSSDPSGFYEFVDSVAEPMSEAEERVLASALQPYFDAVREEETVPHDDFFHVERIGHLRMGVGSALDVKYLVRVRGATENPFDDVVLEVKQVRDIRGIPCITLSPSADPLRVLRGHTRIAYEPYRFLGYARFSGQSFWVHAWEKSYKELEIDQAFKDPEKISEIAFDVGVQLGQGHIRSAAEGMESQMRHEELRLIRRDHDRLLQTCHELARLTVEAWKEFVSKI